MKVVLDTNVYISWIREKKYPEVLLNPNTIKYLSPIVLMELWAGAKSKSAIKLMSKFQEPYKDGGRVIPLLIQHFVQVGQILADIPRNFANKIKSAGFINDLFIAVNSVYFGAILVTSNQSDFELIRKYLPKLKTFYLN